MSAPNTTPGRTLQEFTVKAWGGNAIAFIEGRGLTSEFNDWCGGWPCPVDPKMIAASQDMYAALDLFRSFGCPLCNGDCASANPPVMACPMAAATAALARARGEQS